VAVLVVAVLGISNTPTPKIKVYHRSKHERFNMNHNYSTIFDGINAAMDLVHETSKNAGWYTNVETGLPTKRNFGEVIALMHSELSEALEADRKDLMDDKLTHRPGVEVELADCIIRIFDTAKAMNLDIAGAIIEKNAYNVKRADHKLENRGKANGKKY
jgi:hypothetical protein